MIELLTPENGASVTLLNRKHVEYIRNPKNGSASKIDWLALRETQEDLSFPLPVRFTFSPAVPAVLVLRDPQGRERTVPAENGSAEVTNLLIDADYTWQIRTGHETSQTFSFHTDPTPPRLISVSGISNVRDFGGFRVADGGRVRQGMLYRTSEMDTHANITAEGIRTLTDELGIRTDIDLRGVGGEPRGPVLDPDIVRWYNFPLAAYADCFSETQLKLFGDSYRLLTDANIYPAICHCWGGIDRTGTWLYILGAMLGVSEDDLGLDYEFSSFSRWGCRSRHSEQFVGFLDGLRKFGSTLQERGKGFMKAAGLNDAELGRIRELLTEETRKYG
ncbi:MAG: tyrosine-protein phosphatase [Clostridia bacterium]|nr:tyrosine-protein phosphatase [Clostridia bacterium]